MKLLGDPDDKQVLIDNSETETIPQDSEELKVVNTIPKVDHEDFSSEYEGFQSRVTFQTCSRPNNENISSLELGGRQKWFGVWWQRVVARLTRYVRKIGEWWRFHKKLLLSSAFLVLGSSGCLIFFPLHLEEVSRGNMVEVGDGYSACLVASTVTTLMFLFNCVFLEVLERRKWFSQSVLRPVVGWQSLLKVGFCLGLSFVTIFYSWEDDKVPCNFQDPLLGLVIIFAIITHAVCKWKSIGLKPIFALFAIALGVFVSVDYPLVDHHRCRGYYYRNTEDENSITWTWQVHLVWTSAFVVSIWLATVAAFFLESSIPVPKVKHSRLYDLEYNAVKLRVLTPNNNVENDTSRESTLSSSINHLKSSYRFNPYTKFNLGLVANSVLWFSVTTWLLILSLGWTEFIPGFGKGISVDKLPWRILTAFQTSLTSPSSWALFSSIFLFSHAFTYLTVLTRSPITSISVATIAFPIIGLWWSFFQIKYSFFIWMPVMSGELICATLGLILVCLGCYYFIKYEILKPALVQNKRQLVNHNNTHAHAQPQHY